MSTKREVTKRQYLEPSEFFDKYPGRKRLLADTALEKYVSWVLMEQEPSSPKMAYFLIAAATYGRACNDVTSVEKHVAADSNESDLREELAKLRESNVALVEELDDLKQLQSIRNSEEYRHADMARDKQAVQDAMREVKNLLDAIRLANPHYVEKIEQRLNRVVPGSLKGAQQNPTK